MRREFPESFANVPPSDDDDESDDDDSDGGGDNNEEEDEHDERDENNEEREGEETEKEISALRTQQSHLLPIPPGLSNSQPSNHHEIEKLERQIDEDSRFIDPSNTPSSSHPSSQSGDILEQLSSSLE